MDPKDLLPSGEETPVAEVVITRPTEAEDRATAERIGLMRGEPHSITCGFCECKLTPVRGQVLDMSSKAIGYRDTVIVIRDLRREIQTQKERAEGIGQLVADVLGNYINHAMITEDERDTVLHVAQRFADRLKSIGQDEPVTGVLARKSATLASKSGRW
jgi:hypothetical protein